MKKSFIDAQALRQIVAEYPTPFHLYDERGIRENARRLHQAFAWNPRSKPRPILQFWRFYGRKVAGLTAPH